MIALLRAFFNDAKPLAPADVRRIYRDGDVLLDVRTPPEYVFGHLDGALNADLHDRDFAGLLEALDRDRTYYVYCSSGRRSREAVRLMEQQGFRAVHDAGRLEDLACEGFPLNVPVHGTV